MMINAQVGVIIGKVSTCWMDIPFSNQHITGKEGYENITWKFHDPRKKTLPEL